MNIDLNTVSYQDGLRAVNAVRTHVLCKAAIAEAAIVPAPAAPTAVATPTVTPTATTPAITPVVTPGSELPGGPKFESGGVSNSLYQSLLMAGLGALGGGAVGGLSTIGGSDEEKKDGDRRALTGALIGGLGGGSLGMAWPALKSLWQDPVGKAKDTSAYRSPPDPNGDKGVPEQIADAAKATGWWSAKNLTAPAVVGAAAASPIGTQRNNIVNQLRAPGPGGLSTPQGTAFNEITSILARAHPLRARFPSWMPGSIDRLAAARLSTDNPAIPFSLNQAGYNNSITTPEILATATQPAMPAGRNAALMPHEFDGRLPQHLLPGDGLNPSTIRGLGRMTTPGPGRILSTGARGITAAALTMLIQQVGLPKVLEMFKSTPPAGAPALKPDLNAGLYDGLKPIP